MYIPSHAALGNHPKLRRLARTLAISRPAAVGHLHYLWWWSQEYAPDGDLSYQRYTAEDIADAALWDGDAHAFILALTSSGFVDDEDGRLLLHDWEEYGGKIVKDLAKDRERKRSKGTPPTSEAIPQTSAGVPKPSTGVPPEFQRNSGVDKIKREEIREEEKRKGTRERAADKPPTPADVQVIDSLSEITDDKPYGMVAMLCEENDKEIAAMPTDWRKMQLGIAKRLLLNHSIEQVQAYVRFRKTAWNGGTPFDLRHVEKDIGAWELAGNPATEPPRPMNGHANGRASPADKQERTRGNLVEWFVESEGIGEQIDVRQADGAIGEPLRARTHEGTH
jgi:hypothetical protein